MCRDDVVKRGEGGIEKCHRFYKKSHGIFLLPRKIVPCPPLRRRGLHDVGHVGAATGRGVKPRQAFRGALAEPHPPLSLRWVSFAYVLSPPGVATFVTRDSSTFK